MASACCWRLTGGANGNSQKLAFAAWNSTQPNRYAYVAWDTDVTASTQLPATTSLGYLIQQAAYSGTNLNWEPSNQQLAAFVCGAAAAINFNQTNGRITFAFKGQSGLIPGVTTEAAAQNLAGSPQTANVGNGYNFYGAYATANQQFNFYQRGTVSGPYRWLDSYLNQIWMNNNFQLAIVGLLAQANSIAYAAAGNALISAALQGPINAALNFGAIDAGVTLSPAQIAEVNAQAGASIANTLQTRGWYLQILPGTATTRAARTSPPCTFWYVDGGSVQALNLASIEVQ